MQRTAIAFARSVATRSTSLALPAASVSMFRHAPHRSMATQGWTIDLRDKVAFVAGVADSRGYGWAISKMLAEAGATVIVGASHHPTLAHTTRNLTRQTQQIRPICTFSQCIDRLG